MEKQRIPLSERKLLLNRDLLIELIDKSKLTKAQIARDIGIQPTQIQMAVSELDSSTYRPIPFIHDKKLFDYLNEKISELEESEKELSKLTLPVEELESKMKWYNQLKEVIGNK